MVAGLDLLLKEVLDFCCPQSTIARRIHFVKHQLVFGECHSQHTSIIVLQQTCRKGVYGIHRQALSASSAIQMDSTRNTGLGVVPCAQTHRKKCLHCDQRHSCQRCYQALPQTANPAKLACRLARLQLCSAIGTAVRKRETGSLGTKCWADQV